MLCLDELEACGWTRVAGVATTSAMLEVAKTLGCPIPSPTGEVVKQIRVISASQARPDTLSAVHGIAEFPLHSDTAFWPLPARYVVLRVYGDVRRQTIIRPFEDILGKGDNRLRVLAETSVWVVRTPSAHFYSSMRFRLDNQIGWRYDRQCMFPANDAAEELAATLDPVTTCGYGERISWSGEEAVVLSNWKVLHGRGPAPREEHNRILERIYVR
jgi:hypothetical protein